MSDEQLRAVMAMGLARIGVPHESAAVEMARELLAARRVVAAARNTLSGVECTGYGELDDAVEAYDNLGGDDGS